MPVAVPSSLDEAVAAAREHPGALLLAGGTDLLVELNERHRTLTDPDAVVVALHRVPELRSWTFDPSTSDSTNSDSSTGTLRIGAGVTWSDLERDPLATMVPALAEAARTVGSPQIRNAGTLGGNLATCSPAGDGLPVLAVHDAVVHLVSAAGARSLPVEDFMVGVKRTALAPGELIEAIEVPVLDGWQGYSKVGVRNAMVIATASACVARHGSSVRIALGSVAPTVIRCPEAEAMVVAAVDTNGRLDGDAARAAGRAAADASRPIDDHRSTAAYRRHAVAVMVERLLRRAFADRSEAPA